MASSRDIVAVAKSHPPQVPGRPQLRGDGDACTSMTSRRIRLRSPLSARYCVFVHSRTAGRSRSAEARGVRSARGSSPRRGASQRADHRPRSRSGTRRPQALAPQPDRVAGLGRQIDRLERSAEGDRGQPAASGHVEEHPPGGLGRGDTRPRRGGGGSSSRGARPRARSRRFMPVIVSRRVHPATAVGISAGCGSGRLLGIAVEPTRGATRCSSADSRVVSVAGAPNRGGERCSSADSAQRAEAAARSRNHTVSSPVPPTAAVARTVCRRRRRGRRRRPCRLR